MESYYEINVSQHGRHFFATAPRSCRILQEARQVYSALRSRFPASEGYELSVTEWRGAGFDALREMTARVTKQEG
jgi:hypothetical protein